MKGCSPILKDKAKEISSKIEQTYIELGAVNMEQFEDREESNTDNK